MKPLAQELSVRDAIIREIEMFFKVQETYFNDRTEGNLKRLRIQQNKVKEMIADSKKIIPTLI